jgi:phospholipid/cholesterol/gamma-HCH transport system substrate-binding protein
MDERVMQLRIGLMVLVTVIIIAILLTMFGGQGKLTDIFERKQIFYVEFPEAPGIAPDTPVLKSGIRIGRVTEVRLADDVHDRQLRPGTGVVVTIEIDPNRRIYSDEVCRLERNLLGDSVLEFVRVGGDEASQEQARRDDSGRDGDGSDPDDSQADAQGSSASEARHVVESGATLPGEVQASPVQVVGNLEADLAKAIKSVSETSDEIRDLVQKTSQFLGTREEIGTKQERLRNILDQARSTMENMDHLAQNANKVIGDEKTQQNLRDAAAQAPLVIQDARDTLGQMSASFARMEDTISRVNTSLGSVERFSKRLDERGGAMIERLDRSAETLELLLGEMLTLTHAGTIDPRSGAVREPEPGRDQPGRPQPAPRAGRGERPGLLRQDRPAPGAVGRARSPPAEPGNQGRAASFRAARDAGRFPDAELPSLSPVDAVSTPGPNVLIASGPAPAGAKSTTGSSPRSQAPSSLFYISPGSFTTLQSAVLRPGVYAGSRDADHGDSSAEPHLWGFERTGL